MNIFFSLAKITIKYMEQNLDLMKSSLQQTQSTPESPT